MDPLESDAQSTTTKKHVICCISDFSAEYPGSFIESLSSLSEQCRNAFKLETVCIFPEAARGKAWLCTLDGEKIRYGFVSRSFNAITQIRSVLGENEPVLFHSHFFFYDLVAVLAKLLFYRSAKVVWHYHNPTGSGWLQRGKNLVKLRILGSWVTDRCIAVGDGVYQSLIRARFPANKLMLIHNGINTRRYLRDPVQRDQPRHSMGMQEHQTVFLMLGLDPVRKGVDIFIRAAGEILKQNRANSRFIIVGRKETREFVSNIEVSKTLGQALDIVDPSSDFTSILNMVDVLVSCSRSEAFSYAIAEAMSAEKRIICSNAPGMQEIYGAAYGVWFFPTEDWRNLAGLMLRAMKLTESERRSLEQANRAYIRAHYSLDHWAEKMVQLYDSLLCDTFRTNARLGKQPV